MNPISQTPSSLALSNNLALTQGRIATQEVLSQRVLRRPPTDIQHAALINVDNSGSMFGSGAIEQLQSVIPKFLTQLQADAAIRNSVLIAWGKFGNEKALELSGPFTSVLDSKPPSFEGGSTTPLGERIIASVDVLIAARKYIQSQLHLDQRHSWLIEMTDGDPTDCLQQEARKAVQETAVEYGIEVHLFAVGKDANLDYLRSIEQPGRPAKRLDSETNLADLFTWLRKSFTYISKSIHGEILEIPAIDGSLIRTE